MSSQPDDGSPVTAEALLAHAAPSDWRTLDPARTLYVDLPAGRVVIELANDFAPEHVANIERLARDGYWDGLEVIRVSDNYVLQLADPHADDPERRRGLGAAASRLTAELDRPIDPSSPFDALPDADVYAPSIGFVDGFPVARDQREGRMWLAHTYGTVSAGRDVDPNSGNGAELTIVIGHAPRQLDRNVTAVGRVRAGMHLLSAMPRGDDGLGFYRGDQPATLIRSVRLACDLPEDQRSPLEILRTDTPLFAKLVEARRNRRDPWFHRPAGHVDIGNVPVPVRTVVSRSG